MAQSQAQDQISNALALASTFLSGCLAINVTQVLGAPISLINNDWYNSWISSTKKSFAVLTMTMTERWAPTVVKVSGDESMRGQLFESSKGELLCNFPRRLVMMANHQIYTDWLYLWWIAYTNGMHGRIYIILKESLRRIPVIGWGMQLCQFIFLKRNWEADKPNMAAHLKRLKNVEDPMWLLLFPEGTNLAPSTRESSKRWANKNGIKDMKHTLLPRATGLRFCLEELDETIAYLYDCTIAYEGVPRGQFAQDIYTIQASYVNGKPPKCVNMYWRRFPVSSIPIHDERKFELWLRARWMEKDSLIEYYHTHGRFPADTGSEKGPTGRTRRGAGYVSTTIKANRWNEFLSAFMPMGLLAMIMYSFYGALPDSLVQKFQQQSVMDNVKQIREADISPAQKEAVIKAASQATGVKSVNVQKALHSQNKSNSTTNATINGVKPKLTPASVKTTPVKKKPPKLGPRSVGSASVAPSTAASTVGSAPKLGPRKTAPSTAATSVSGKQGIDRSVMAKSTPKQTTQKPTSVNQNKPAKLGPQKLDTNKSSSTKQPAPISKRS